MMNGGKTRLITIFLVLLPILLHAHGAEGDHSTARTVIGFLGSLHPIAIHFPIALLVMTGASELLSWWTKAPVFEYSSRFLIVSAAILSIPAALLGLAWAYGTTFSGGLADLLWWHRFFGLCTPILAIGAAVLKLLHAYGKWRVQMAYYWVLGVAIAAVLAAGFFGGEMVFGTFQFKPDQHAF